MELLARISTPKMDSSSKRMSLLPFLLALAAGGCTPDPCAGYEGACLTVQALGDIGPVDAVRFDLRGPFTAHHVAPLPQDQRALPALLMVPLPGSGEVSVDGVALLLGRTVGLGRGAVSVPPGAHVTLDLPFQAVSGATCTDGYRDGDESDVDCGGACPACADGKSCDGGSACISGVCLDGRCQAPSCTDRVKNGAESDVDCGGGACPKCAEGRSCGSDSDCASGGC
jgi:hypothetical protein